MDLNITAELLRELAERADLSTRPDDTWIVVTDRGFEVQVRTGDAMPPWPQVVNAAGLAAHFPPLDSDADEVSKFGALDFADDDARRLYLDLLDATITDEHGVAQLPDEHVDAVVALPIEPDGLAETYGEHGAYWFDRAAAVRVVENARVLRGEDGAEHLWVTSGGHYLIERDSARGGRHTLWYEIDGEEVASLVYDAELTPARDVEPATPLIAAAVATAQAVAAVADAVADDPAAVVALGGIISELVRVRALPSLRAARAHAARSVLRGHDGNVSATTRTLNAHRPISQRTVKDLLDHNPAEPADLTNRDY